MRKRNRNTQLIFYLIGILLIQACNSDDDTQIIEPITTPTTLKLDLNEFIRSDAGVMMQAFYWDVEPIFGWYDVVSTKIEDWSNAGINRIWLPAPGKGQAGMYSMGYDPSDYFDVGEFDQHGTVETRFGSRNELEQLIQKSHEANIEVIADIVMGHNSGGGLQANPFRDGQEVYTLFNEQNGNASGKFNRNYEHFHPNSYQDSDPEASFYPETDLSHAHPYVQDWLWGRDNSVAAFYKSLGFDGWRFDYVKSFDAKWVKAWNDKIGGFSVGEYFDGNEQELINWVEASESPAFDFACFYRLDETLDRAQDLTALGNTNNTLWKLAPDKAVTFVANHDTEKDENPNNRISYANKLLAYAYMLTHEGYPTIFYLDYENESFKPQLKNLIQLNRSLATGAVEILVANKEEYIMKRSGSEDNPGLILYMNIGSSTKSFEVQTSWNSKTLVDYTDNSPFTPKADSDGNVTIYVPGRSFAIWSIAAE